MWDVMTIEEGFRKQEGLNSGGHALYTAPQLTKGELEMPRNAHPPTLGRPVNLSERWYEMARSLVMDGNDSVSTIAAQRMQNQRLPGHVVRSFQFPGEAPQRGTFVGNGLQCQSRRSGRQRSDRRSSDGEVWENPLRAGEREASATGGVHGRAQPDGLQYMAEHRTFGVDVYTSS